MQIINKTAFKVVAVSDIPCLILILGSSIKDWTANQMLQNCLKQKNTNTSFAKLQNPDPSITPPLTTLHQRGKSELGEMKYQIKQTTGAQCCTLNQHPTVPQLD